MTNAGFDSIADFRDIESVNHYHHAVAAGADPETVLAGLRRTGRDNARTPMQWTSGPNAGFTTGTPWIAVNPNHDVVNAEAARADPDSVFHHYRRLIELRHTEPVVALGDFTMLLPHHEQVYAFTRRLGAVELLVLCNVSGDPVDLDLPDADAWGGTEVLLTTRPGHPAPADLTVLAPWEARVHRRTHGGSTRA